MKIQTHTQNNEHNVIKSQVGQTTSNVALLATSQTSSDIQDGGVRPLRSSDALMLNVPRTRTEFAHRPFWNSLSSDVRSYRTADTLKRHLKSQDPSVQKVLT